MYLSPFCSKSLFKLRTSAWSVHKWVDHLNILWCMYEVVLKSHFKATSFCKEPPVHFSHLWVIIPRIKKGIGQNHFVWPQGKWNLARKCYISASVGNATTSVSFSYFLVFVPCVFEAEMLGEIGARLLRESNHLDEKILHLSLYFNNLTVFS